MNDADLFCTEWVHVQLDAREMPGYKAARIICAVCGEGINYDRQVRSCDAVGSGQILCQGCAFPADRYYQPLASAKR